MYVAVLIRLITCFVLVNANTQPRPVIAVPSKVYVALDQPAQISCDVTSTVPYTVTWSKYISKGQLMNYFGVMETIGDFESVNDLDRNYRVEDDILILPKNEEGQFQCTATNEAGSISEKVFVEIAVCEPQCSNGGNCVSPNICECPTGWTGNHCKQAVCEPSCSNGGNCVSPQNCECPTGWTGIRCQHAVCEPSCSNGGNCVGPNNCECPTGWTGNRCQQAVCEPSCSNGGNCVSPQNCECPIGWTGNHCQLAVCEPSCSNGGNCVSPQNCECPIGWTGNRCQQAVCIHPCINGGTCVSPNICDCPKGWTGTRCNMRQKGLLRRFEVTCEFDSTCPESQVCNDRGVCFSPPMNDVTVFQNDFKDAVENVKNRINHLATGIPKCGQSNIEKLLNKLDKQFRKMTDTLISNITDVVAGLPRPSPPKYFTPIPKGCLPPFYQPPFVRKMPLGCVYMSDIKVSWRQAKRECEDMGARLIVNPPLSPLLYYITQEGHSTTDFWIGGKYSDSWRWLDGEIISEGWNQGEPDFTKSTACVYFNWSGEGLLNDHLCRDKKLYICEKL